MKINGDSMKIGDLASMFGLTARSIRYYEELGLLKSNDRTEGLHRRYPGRNIVYLKRIKQLKTYGLSLGEIKEFFDLAEEDPSGERCKALLIKKYEERIDTEETTIREAQRRMDELRSQADCLRGSGRFFACPGEDCGECDTSEFCDMTSDTPW
ncbi:MAG TPA: MerR family transcriptional regulator [Rectinemataceae bacterium]|nr:MerR family transcriptional regulator [Rectinemataceae bacterium]